MTQGAHSKYQLYLEQVKKGKELKLQRTKETEQRCKMEEEAKNKLDEAKKLKEDEIKLKALKLEEMKNQQLIALFKQQQQGFRKLRV